MFQRLVLPKIWQDELLQKEHFPLTGKINLPACQARLSREYLLAAALFCGGERLLPLPSWGLARLHKIWRRISSILGDAGRTYYTYTLLFLLSKLFKSALHVVSRKSLIQEVQTCIMLAIS